MRVDRKWVERNLGFDPIATPPPDATFASARAAKAETPEEFQREIIDFDSESPAGLQFMAFSIGVESACVVNLVDEAGKVGCNVREGH
jgi:hypothetical protein